MIYTTQAEVRHQFWVDHPQLNKRVSWSHRSHLGRTPGHVARVTQNDYPTDTRVAFVEYVDHLRRNGDISEELASRVTLA